MSGSVSPLPWTGSKGCIYTTIDAFMPPHKTYVEACMGSAEVFLRKKPVEREIINDYNGDLVKFFTFVKERLHNMLQSTKPGEMFEELLIGNYDLKKQAEENNHCIMKEAQQLTLFDFQYDY